MHHPTFTIREIPIYGPLVLAPLAGYTDQPFRRLCREYGASLTYTGLLASNAIVHRVRMQDLRMQFCPEERPVVGQVFGNDVATIVAAARIVEARGADIIDVNLGCAKHKITKGGHASALLKTPAKIGQIFAALTRILTVPVTGKIRLGWDAGSRNYLEVVRILEDNGASLIAVHGRTSEQLYRGVADWDAIAEVKQTVHVPVLASGDVVCVADIDRILAHTGCDGVMLGRGSMGHPWLFQRRNREDVSLAERVPIIQRHLREMLAFHGDYHGLMGFRKHLHRYLYGVKIGRIRRQTLLTCEDADELSGMIASLVNLPGSSTIT